MKIYCPICRAFYCPQATRAVLYRANELLAVTTYEDALRQAWEEYWDLRNKENDDEV